MIVLLRTLEGEVLSSGVELMRYYSSFSLRAMQVHKLCPSGHFVNKPSTRFYFK